MCIQALFLGTLAIAVSAQRLSSTTSSPNSVETTLNLFIDPRVSAAGVNGDLIGSVVDTNLCATIYEIACNVASSVLSDGGAPCDPLATVFATYGPGSYRVATQDEFGGVFATALLACNLEGATRAVCSISEVVTTVGGKKTRSSTVTTLTGQQVFYAQISITAGASKLSHLAPCTSSSSGAAATGISEVYKMLIAPGATALLAAGL